MNILLAGPQLQSSQKQSSAPRESRIYALDLSISPQPAQLRRELTNRLSTIRQHDTLVLSQAVNCILVLRHGRLACGVKSGPTFSAVDLR